MNDCRVIEQLWIELNPHVQIHGCEIDPAGSVKIYVLYSRNKKMHPLELCLGNPPKTVIRGLKQAVSAQSRAKRLTVTGSTKIAENEPSGAKLPAQTETAGENKNDG